MNKNLFIIFLIIIISITTLAGKYDVYYEAEVEPVYYGNSDSDIRLDITADTDKELDKDTFLTLRGRLLSDEDDTTIKFDRFYLERYEDKLKITAGKQRIYWGLSQVFNYTDIFNRIDITDTKADHTGVKALKLLYNTDYFSRIELANEFKDGKDSFAIRYTKFINGWEYMLNYLDYNNVFDSKDYIFEFKGDIEIGVWGQIIRKKTIIDMDLYVLGMDYSWDINYKTLYFMTEYTKNDTLDVDYTYYNASYNINMFSSIMLNYMTSSINSKEYYGVSYDYTIDDFQKLTLAYNRFYSFNNSLVPGNNRDKEFYINWTYSW